MSEIDAGGLGALEMVTRSMKAFGMSHCSTLSYGRDPVSGLAVEYAEVFHELTTEQREIYNNAATAWQVVLQNIEAALEITDAGTRKRAFALSHFWAQHQAFFRQVITAFKVPECIKQIEAALKRHESAVVSIIGTAEAKSKVLVARAAAQAERLEDLDFSPRATLCALVERAFPVDLYQQVEDPVSHSIITVRVTVEQGNAVQSQEALRMRAELLEKLSDLVLPENPLDQIVNYFGPDQVAEISGRRKRLVRDTRNGEVRYVSRTPKGVPMNKINVHENEQFQNGAKRIAIITAAGSTGISLHSSLNAINQQRRCQIVLELAWSAVLQMQSFGRTHRSFQKYPPKYILLSTNLGGERRFSATIARRLASLGALCKGDRKAADGGTQLSRYTFESPLGRGTLDLLYRRIFEGKEFPDLDNPREALEDMGLLNKDGEINDRDRYHIPRFLNRPLSLDCDRQNALFAYYSDLFEQCVAHAKASGTFDEGVQDIKALSIKLAGEPEVVYIDETTKAETLHYTLAVKTRSTRVTAHRAAAMLENSNGGGFYRQSKGNVVLATISGNHTDHQSGKTYQTYAVFNLEDNKLKFANYYKMPAAQSDSENCVAHNGSLIPVPGRDIEVQAWYQGGVSVMDFTDAEHPVEIAYYDRGPFDPKMLVLGGDWSAYWYNGHIYASEIARGLDVFELTPTKFLTQNEIDAAKTVQVGELNVQNQEKIEWARKLVVAKAYVDQLERSQALPADRIASLRQAIESAESSRLNQQDIAKLKELAPSVESSASTTKRAADSTRLQALAEILNDPAR